MPRARNIKPGFFTNGDLLECQPLARLLFAGLWCEADRRGILEDRPKTIKVKILPADNCDIDALLVELENHGFIRRYLADGQRCIFIENFKVHQNPHVKEQANSLPAPDMPGVNTVQDADESGVNPADSLLPLTDSGLLTEDGGEPTQAPEAPPDPPLPTPPEKPKKAPREERETKAPASFELSDEHYEFGAKYGFTTQEVQMETEKFLNYCRAKGKRYVVWHSAWNNWIIGAKKYRDEGAAKTVPINGRRPPIETFEGNPIYDHRGNPTPAFYLKQAHDWEAEDEHQPERTSA